MCPVYSIRVNFCFIAVTKTVRNSSRDKALVLLTVPRMLVCHREGTAVFTEAGTCGGDAHMVVD